MRASMAKQLLGCTYTTLHNYVKNGKLKLSEHPTTKQQEYDDKSVYDMMDKLNGKKTFHNEVILFLNNHQYQFKLDKVIINKILDLINFELKRESLYDEFNKQDVYIIEKEKQMLNKKFLTKLLNKDFRSKVLLKNKKFVGNPRLKMKQYATYAVDKHNKERNEAMKDIKAAKYGFCPVDVLAYCAVDGNVKKSLFEFNSINHFLVEGDHDTAVEVALCILSQLARENKKDIDCFDIDKIDADMKKCEEEYLKAKEELEKLKENNEKEKEGEPSQPAI